MKTDSKKPHKIFPERCSYTETVPKHHDRTSCSVTSGKLPQQLHTKHEHTAVPQNPPDYRPATGLRWCSTSQRILERTRKKARSSHTRALRSEASTPPPRAGPNPQLRPPACPLPAHQAAAALVRHILKAGRCRGGGEGRKAARSSSVAAAAKGREGRRRRAAGPLRFRVPGPRCEVRLETPPLPKVPAAPAARRSWPFQPGRGVQRLRLCFWRCAERPFPEGLKQL